MGPSFSSKNGVRYHFYVSTALRGRKHQAGSVTRISAPEVESLVEAAVRNDLKLIDAPREEVLEHAEGVTVSGDRIRIALRKGQSKRSTIQIPWSPKAKGQTETRPGPSERTDQKFLKSIVRAHAWLNDLSTTRLGATLGVCRAATVTMIAHLSSVD